MMTAFSSLYLLPPVHERLLRSTRTYKKKSVKRKGVYKDRETMIITIESVRFFTSVSGGGYCDLELSKEPTGKAGGCVDMLPGVEGVGDIRR